MAPLLSLSPWQHTLVMDHFGRGCKELQRNITKNSREFGSQLSVFLDAFFVQMHFYPAPDSPLCVQQSWNVSKTLTRSKMEGIFLSCFPPSHLSIIRSTSLSLSSLRKQERIGCLLQTCSIQLVYLVLLYLTLQL